MNTKPIQEFIIQSEDNLRIAQAVADALPNARQKLAEDFITRLDVCLKRGLSGWKSSRDWPFFSHRYGTYSLWKPEWADQYGLALQFSEFGKKMVFGVYREKDKIGDRAFCDELMNAIKPGNPLAITNAYWEANIPMESPAADWQKPEVLWRMHKDEDDSFLKDVAEQLLELARISEPIVDRLVRKHKK